MNTMLQRRTGPTLEGVARLLEQENRPSALPELLVTVLCELAACHDLSRAPGGFYAELRSVAPELGTRLLGLSALHRNIMTLTRNMIKALDSRPPGRWALTAKASLAEMIREQDADERCLLHEAYLRDVGGSG